MTVYERFAQLAAEQPDARMFIEPVEQGHREVTRAQLLDHAHRIAGVLQELGLGPGDCAAVQLPNWSDAVAWQVAASAVGAHVIGVNTRYNVAEIRHILAKAQPRALAVAHGFRQLDLIGRARQAAADVPAAQRPVVVPVTGPGGPAVPDASGLDLGAGTAVVPPAGDHRAELAFSPAAVDPERIGVAFTTSGSTGMPKLAGHREQAVLWHADAVGSRLRFRSVDVLVGALPFSGVFGFSAIMAALNGGASVLMHPAFDPQELLEQMSRFRASHYVGADDMLQRLRRAWEQDPQDLSAWRWIGIADFEGKSREIAAWASREFGTQTVGVYGSSELFALTAFWEPDTDPGRRWNGGGLPVSPDIALRIADPLDDRPVEADEEGELQFSGPNVVDAYLGDAGEAAAAFTDDGWFRSGDLGRASDDGGFVYVCRMGDVLRLKGFLVDPSEIERRLAEHPAVHTAKAVGVPDADGQTQVVAFVTLREDAEDADGQALRDWCAQALARFKVPASVQVIDQMPTTAGTNGTKIKAAQLRTWAAEQMRS